MTTSGGKTRPSYYYTTVNVKDVESVVDASGPGGVYELMRSGKKYHKVIMDVDLEMESNVLWTDRKEVCDEVRRRCEWLARRVCEYHKVPVRYVVYTSSRNNKVSYHVVVPNVYYRNLLKMRDCLRKLESEMGKYETTATGVKVGETMIDMSIYKRS